MPVVALALPTIRQLASLKSRLIYRALHPSIERDLADLERQRVVAIYLPVGAGTDYGADE